MAMKRKVLVGVAAALAVGGAGAGIATATLTGSSPSEESKAIVNDAAKNLGVEPDKLSAAIKKALADRVNAAVKSGRLTNAEGDEMKRRIASDEFPLFGPPAFGHGFGAPHPFFHGLDAATDYLGLTEAQLRGQLERGKSLAQIAKARGKSVAGLKDVLLKDVKAKLDEAVKAGRLSKAEEQRALQGFEDRIDALVEGKLRERFREHRGFRFRGGFDRHGPPPFAPAPGAAA